MRLSEFKDEEALEVLAEMLEPTIEIMTDEDVREMFEDKNAKMYQVAAKIIKEHPKSIMHIMAVMNRVPEGEYHCNLFTLAKSVIELLSDKELWDFFKQQGQQIAEDTSGSVMANTEAGEV